MAMRLKLFLTLKGVQYYGYIPFIKDGETTAHRIENFELSSKDEDLLDEDFVIPINDLCGSLIGPGDIDYLNAKQCKLMLKWLEERLNKPVHPDSKRYTTNSSNSPTKPSNSTPASYSTSKR